MKGHILLLGLLCLAVALDNGLAKTPAMGWNSWNHFACNISQALIKETADLLVSSNLSAKGYKYVNLDDCWQIARNNQTKEIIEDRAKFPSGMAALGEYIHSKGLLFGLYSDAGTYTCQKRPGSLGFERIDANTYAKWKVDYLKYDNCYNDKTSSKIRYPVMRDALNDSGRHIYFSMCQWGQQDPYLWAMPVGNSWRTTGDISDSWNSFIDILGRQVGLSKYSGPGGWNDPDMLEVGNGKMTNDQYQAHFSLWAALKSPLLIGCNLKTMSNDTLTILRNDEVIAINQDPLGKQADRIQTDGASKQVWGGELSQGRYVLIFLNKGTTINTFTFDFAKYFPGKVVSAIRDVIEHKDVTVPTTSVFTTKPISHHAVGNYVITFKSQTDGLQTE